MVNQFCEYYSLIKIIRFQQKQRFIVQWMDHKIASLEALIKAFNLHYYRKKTPARKNRRTEWRLNRIGFYSTKKRTFENRENIKIKLISNK